MSHISDATEIYRHIQLATLYKLENLEKKCIYIASEIKLKELETAASKYPISNDILVQIHHTACKRYEIDQQDDQFLINKRGYGFGLSSDKTNNTYKDILKAEILGKSGSSMSNIQRLRLCYRYFAHEEVMLEEAVKGLKTYMMTTNKGELELLPEMIKQKLEI